MQRKMTPMTCTTDRRLCHDPACPVHGAKSPGKKQPRSVIDRAELASAFLADRGCLEPHHTHDPRKNAA